MMMLRSLCILAVAESVTVHMTNGESEYINSPYRYNRGDHVIVQGVPIALDETTADWDTPALRELLATPGMNFIAVNTGIWDHLGGDPHSYFVPLGFVGSIGFENPFYSEATESWMAQGTFFQPSSYVYRDTTCVAMLNTKADLDKLVAMAVEAAALNYSNATGALPTITMDNADTVNPWDVAMQSAFYLLVQVSYILQSGILVGIVLVKALQWTQHVRRGGKPSTIALSCLCLEFFCNAQRLAFLYHNGITMWAQGHYTYSLTGWSMAATLAFPFGFITTIQTSFFIQETLDANPDGDEGFLGSHRKPFLIMSGLVLLVNIGAVSFISVNADPVMIPYSFAIIQLVQISCGTTAGVMIMRATRRLMVKQKEAMSMMATGQEKKIAYINKLVKRVYWSAVLTLVTAACGVLAATQIIILSPWLFICQEAALFYSTHGTSYLQIMTYGVPLGKAGRGFCERTFGYAMGGAGRSTKVAPGSSSSSSASSSSSSSASSRSGASSKSSAISTQA